jgi:hypothetical protein
VYPVGVPVEACDGRVVQADAQRMTHVVHRSALRYRLQSAGLKGLLHVC